MEFQRCQYVVGRERTELARQLNLSETQVPAPGCPSWAPASLLHKAPNLALDRAMQGRVDMGRVGKKGQSAPSDTLACPPVLRIVCLLLLYREGA